jgi:hypothetical protein
MTENNAYRQQVESYFTPERVIHQAESFSPSGRFRLLPRIYSTKPSAWNYSRGTVYRVADGYEVCDIKRNLSGFHHTFFNRHGQEWLLAGRSYMSQTLVNLETGEEFEPSGDQYNSSAFCWQQGFISPDGNTWAVLGCYWACPEEIKFFDFSHPAQGWPELPIVPGGFVDAGENLKLAWTDEKEITIQYGESVYEPSGQRWAEMVIVDKEKAQTAGRDKTNWQPVVDVALVLQRVDNQMVLVSEWLSEDEIRRRDEAEVTRQAFRRWRETYTSTNEIYLMMKQCAAAYQLPPTDDGVRGSPPNRILSRWFRRKQPKTSVDVEWYEQSGNITVQLYDAQGKRRERLTFPLTVAGMQEAMERVRDEFVIAG